MKPISFTVLKPLCQVALTLATSTGAANLYAQSLGEFATRAQVLVPPGIPIARTVLPAASIAALRSGGGGDLRVFNAGGVSVPHALIDASAEARVRSDAPGVRVVALPIYAAAQTDTGSAQLLRIEEGPKRRVIEYGAFKTASDFASEPRGLLFDMRLVDTAVRAVDLDGILPRSSVVRVSLDISRDLKEWTSIARDAPVFDFGAEGPSNRRILLTEPKRLKDHYVRLTWGSSNRLQIAALYAVSADPLPEIPRTSVALGAPVNLTDDAAEWLLPSSLAASGLHISTSASNALMPVRLLTRGRPGDPWVPIATTVVYRLVGTEGADNTNPPQSIRGSAATLLRVEALAGYTLKGIPLTLDAHYPPLQVAFVANGDGPFTIGTGKTGVAAAALPVSILMPGYTVGSEFSLPIVSARVVADTVDKSAWADVIGRSALLWSVLGLAVAVLSVLAISVLRAPTRK